jgi:sterol desaturase/sphingolipid hydroxylase (fatty acid hydroxylase superfamily)
MSIWAQLGVSRAHLALEILPVAAAAIAGESLWYRHRLGRSYPWRESWLSLQIAFGHRLSQMLSGALLAGLLAWVWRQRVYTVPLDTAWGLAVLFVCEEFVYYWQHRWSHTVRWLWATHSVHHSTQELTLSSAYRLGWTGALSGLPLFFVPPVLFGLHPLALLVMLGINLVYQFWLHTQLVPRLGWFDGLFNSPSNHRVHHACNPEYIDRNYGGILIVFDRLFGTYQRERADLPCRYGLAQPPDSDTLWSIAFSEWRRMLADAGRAPGWRAKLRAVLGPP